MAEAVSEWLALAVKDVDEKKLLPGAIGKDGMRPHLPTQMVKIPFDDPDQVAVVSWRWDGDLKNRGSRNIASVIHCAKQRGIQYLFIDIISIDQKLPASDLIKQVAAFSTLYTKITVLAAYDMEETNVGNMVFTVLRPWILNEMRLFRQNPGIIVYVGHSNQGTISALFRSRTTISTWGQNKRPYFVALLDRIWHSSFFESILGVLLGDVGMSFVSDFKHIIQAYSHVCSLAYEQMERNDYLLTMEILCSDNGRMGTPVGSQSFDRGIQDLHYSRYSFIMLPAGSDELSTTYKVSLDGKAIALWNHRHDGSKQYQWYEVSMLLDNERFIFAALGLTKSQYRDFVGTEEAIRTCLRVDNREEIPVPTVEAIEVDFLSK